MRDETSSEPSLLLAEEHHIVHREHTHNHGWLHHIRQQAPDATETTSAAVITEVIQTVSVVAQIDVDGNGNTFSVLTVLADATGGASQAILTDSPSATTTTDSALPSYSALPAPSSTASGSSSSSSPSSTNVSTSTLSSSQTPFSSLISSSNSTTLISSSSSSSHSTNSTSASSSTSGSISSSLFSSHSPSQSSSRSSTHTFASSTSSFTSHVFSITSSSSYPYSTSTSSQLDSGSGSGSATSTDSGGGVIGGAGATSASATPSSASSGHGNDTGSGVTVSTSAVVGGVVGSVAGIALVCMLLLFFVKWKKNHGGSLVSLGNGRDGAGPGAGTGLIGPTPQPSGGMSERRSFVPAALASIGGFNRSQQRAETPVSERGFVRVSGRKLPSVLQHGGDGYGDNMPVNTLSDTSWYSDTHGFYGGPGTPTFSPRDMNRDSGRIGTPVMRPSPARTPVTEQGPFADPSTPPPIEYPVRPRDALGRSHPSYDGSHTSKFTEEV